MKIHGKTYDEIRKQIDRAEFGYIDSKSLLARDIKRDLHRHVDIITELMDQKKDIDRRIAEQRRLLKELSKKWDV